MRRFHPIDMQHDTILSVSPDVRVLQVREHAMQAEGFVVTSVTSESAAMFEIEMGRCGVLVLCHLLREDAQRSLSQHFRKYCSEGTVIGIVRPPNKPSSPDVDISVEYSTSAENLVVALLSDPELRELAS